MAHISCLSVLQIVLCCAAWLLHLYSNWLQINHFCKSVTSNCPLSLSICLFSYSPSGSVSILVSVQDKIWNRIYIDLCVILKTICTKLTLHLHPPTNITIEDWHTKLLIIFYTAVCFFPYELEVYNFLLWMFLMFGLKRQGARKEKYDLQRGRIYLFFCPYLRRFTYENIKRKNLEIKFHTFDFFLHGECCGWELSIVDQNSCCCLQVIITMLGWQPCQCQSSGSECH